MLLVVPRGSTAASRLAITPFVPARRTGRGPAAPRGGVLMRDALRGYAPRTRGWGRAAAPTTPRPVERRGKRGDIARGDAAYY
jgi:hypothetical protein